MNYTSVEKLYAVFKEHPHVCTDTRDIKPGSIFFALKGANFNGNTFANQALEKGCAYAVIDEAQASPSSKLLLVKDVLDALQQLSNYHRRQLSIPFLAITGSNGKTTTKELVTAVLSSQFNTQATKGNLNNHIGVPLTLLSVNATHQMAVIEMGANHVGEIAALCKIAEPDYGLITNIGKAHLEGFGGPEGVIKAKGEMYDYIRAKKGKLFVNTDNELLVKLAKGIDTISYGQSGNPFCKGYLTEADPLVKVEWENKKLNIATQLVGKYNTENILAAICIGDHFTIAPEKIKHAIESYTPSNSRSQVVKTNHNTVILDAYNANPSSMREAIENFASINAASKALILGDMFELGQQSAEEHQQLIDLLKQKKFEQVILIGKNFAAAKNTINARLFITTEEAAQWLKEHPIKGNTLLVKGSRGVKLETLMDKL